MKEARYHLSGKRRKELAVKAGEILGEEPEYLNAPTYAYRTGGFTVGRDGTLSGGDEDALRSLVRDLKAEGFTPDDETGLSITMPMMTGDELSRLEQLIASKEDLIKKAVGAESLTVEESDGKLSFSWFKGDADPDEMKAYMDLVSALCRMARESTRVNAKARPAENEKYAFRCFLLRLGFIGDEFKEDRKILLKNLSGSSAFKGGEKHEVSGKESR